MQRHVPIRADTDPPTATPASETCHWHSVAAQPLLQRMFGEAHQYGTWAIYVTRKRMKDSLDFRRFPPRACIRERIDYCLGNLIFSGDLGSQKNQLSLLLELDPSRWPGQWGLRESFPRAPGDAGHAAHALQRALSRWETAPAELWTAAGEPSPVSEWPSFAARMAEQFSEHDS